MIISEYKLTSPKLSGEIVFTYNAGRLFSIVFKLQQPLTSEQIAWLFGNLPYFEDVIAEGNKLKLQRTTLLPAMDKVGMFCAFYKRHVKDFDGNPLEYIRSKKDHLIIRSFDVNDLLLTTYFTSDKVLFKGNYSIVNYCKFFNQLRAEAAGANKKARFPNHWDADFVKKLEGPALSDYFKHLNSLGLKPHRNERGDILDFIPSQPSDVAK